METKKNTMNTKDVIAKDNLTLRDYAQIKFMSAIISNALLGALSKFDRATILLLN